MTLDIDKEATYLAINARLHEIITREDEQTLVEYVRQISPEWDVVILGVTGAYYEQKLDSFEWIMHILCRHKGFEEVVASFFIINYQKKHNINR